MNAPCKDCEERHHNCHAHCEAYREYNDENVQRNAEKRRRIEIRQYQYDFHERYVKKTKGRK